MHLFLSTKKSRYSIWRSELHERHKLLLKTGVDSFTGHPVQAKCGDLEKVKSVCGLSSRVLSDVGGGGGGGSGNIV